MLRKICGTTNYEDARMAVELGAEALGFIFAPSKRRVTVAEVAAITAQLPAHVQRVGVFTEPDVATIVAAVRGAGLTAVQMHWSYDPATVAALQGALAATPGEPVAFWQVVGFEVQPADPEEAARRFVDTLRAARGDGRLAAVLLDSVKGGVSGGQGVPFPWAEARRLIDEARGDRAIPREAEPRLVLAGGLRPENVEEAVAALKPDGVDVVSGVEKSPGQKDPDLVRQFLERASSSRTTN